MPMHCLHVALGGIAVGASKWGADQTCSLYCAVTVNIVMTLCMLQLVAADARGEKVVHAHPASDMWALGVLAYEMFAG